MRRALGFALLQAAAALFAQRRIAERRARARALRSFCDMLEQLRGLLESDASPLPQLLETLAGRCADEARAFAESLCRAMGNLGRLRFQELWERALSGYAGLLGPDAARELTSLGAVLGRYDLATELDALDVSRRRLRGELDALAGARAQDARLTLGLAFSASLLLGILLL